VTALRLCQLRTLLASLRTARLALGIGADAVEAPFAAAFGFAVRFGELRFLPPRRRSNGMGSPRAFNSASHCLRPATIAAIVFVMPLSVMAGRL
jgi:hypothetical protein